jgi:hypothetical protein
MGGKPSKGTSADMRLKANMPKAAKTLKESKPPMVGNHGPDKVNVTRNASDPDPYSFASKPWQGK